MAAVNNGFRHEIESFSSNLPEYDAGTFRRREHTRRPSTSWFDDDPDLADSDDGSALQRIERMQLRKQSPKIRRRKRRSKVPVDPIVQELEEETLFYQSQLTPDEVSRQLEESTTRIQRATDRFLDAVENMRESNSFHGVEVLFGDQGHPVSNEIKDAIDEGFSTLQRCYNYCIQDPSASRLHLKPLGAQTKTLLMAFLALPPLPSNYIQVATFCGALAQYFGCHQLVSSSDHAAAHFYNLLRYVQQQQQPDDEDTLEALCEPTEILFRNHQVLLKELTKPPAIAVQIDACLGTRMHSLLVNRTC